MASKIKKNKIINNKPNLLICIVGLALILFLGSISRFDTSAKLLKAEITHSDSLPALDKRLRVGAVFDKSMLNVEGDQRLNFFQIPEWFAGNFSCYEIVQTSYFDYTTNKQNNSIQRRPVKQDNICWGDVRDSQNRIWVEDHTPSSITSENIADNSYIYGISKENYPVMNNGQEIVFKETNMNTLVDKKTNKIKIVTAAENYSTYTPTPDNNIRMDRSLKIFSPEGKPLALMTDYSILIRKGPMPVPANKAEIEKDLAIFLKQFSK